MAELPAHEGVFAGPQVPKPDWHPFPQNSSVLPQNPYSEQQIFNGQMALSDFAYWPHGAFASQLEMHTSFP